MNQKLRLPQAGFTLVELVIVIVILGVLAAFALPRFADLGADAEKASLEGAAGAVKSAVAAVRMKYKAEDDDESTEVDVDGKAVTVVKGEGYPVAAAGGIDEAVDLDDAKYDITPDGSGKAEITLDDVDSTCTFTYDESDGSVTEVACPSA